MYLISFTQRERDAGSSCIISMVTSSITIQDPRDLQSRRSFSFDYRGTANIHAQFIPIHTRQYGCQ
uniref:Uncharacterized protein n=1 Tax=Gouania willdenowi TaxID=441366 RepID=A0A8C5GMT3_GOUWI